MAIIENYLKDGTEVGTVAGYKITEKKFPTVYKILERIEERNGKYGNLRTNKESK